MMSESSIGVSDLRAVSWTTRRLGGYAVGGDDVGLGTGGDGCSLGVFTSR